MVVQSALLTALLLENTLFTFLKARMSQKHKGTYNSDVTRLL